MHALGQNLTNGFVGRLALATILGFQAAAQTTPATVMTIEMENVVGYLESFADPAKNGTSAEQQAPVPPVTFAPGYIIADIAAINGKKARGTAVTRYSYLNLNANPTGNQGIADVNRFALMDIAIEIQQADGSGIGALVLTGLTGGVAPLGAPKSAPTGNFAVTGGTGAFYGARGQAATIRFAARSSSTLENPINRRTFPGGQWQLVVQLIPLKTPEILLTGSVPAIVHSRDFSLVNSQKPAQAGEILTLYASDLGPTRPGVNPGQMFPSGSSQLVASPIEVLVNGKPSEVLYAGGYPDTVDKYQVNFRVPADTTPGLATIQLSAAWILGHELRVPVQ